MARQDRTQAFRNFLAAGKSVSTAAASAGIAPEELDAALSEIVKERRQDAIPMGQVAFSRLMSAIDTLEELCHDAEDERARVSAAKALLDFACKAQVMRLAEDASAGEKPKALPDTLWDFT